MKKLNEVVIDAMEFFESEKVTKRTFNIPKKCLVIASGNAVLTGKIIFRDHQAVFSDEGRYREILELYKDTDAVVVISASGEKHAPIIIEDLQNAHPSKKLYLFTCSENSSAATLLRKTCPENVFVTKSIPEPITYNTSTYLGMILGKTGEEPGVIKKHIFEVIQKKLDEVQWDAYEAFFILIEPEFDVVREMFVTKFDELFGGRLLGRCYTSEQTYHAKTVVPWEKELFISIGYQNSTFGNEKNRLNLPLYEGANFAAVIAVGYYTIGIIQSKFPQWFEQNADEYKKIQIKWFEEMKR